MKETTSPQLVPLDEKLRLGLPLTCADAAKYFGVTERTVDRWERAYGLPCHRLGAGAGAHKRYLLEELDAWFRSRCSVNQGAA